MNGKLFAFLAVLTILGASFSCCTFTEQQEPDESLTVTLIAVAVIAVVAVQAGWQIHELQTSSDVSVQSYDRLAEANQITAMSEVAAKFTANSNANYAQIWSMTKEHWVRQAELEAYAQWESGKSYNPDSVLTEARAYENNSVMSANALAQFDSFLDTISDRTKEWQSDTTDTMKDKMEISYVLGNTKISSKDGRFGGDVLSVADSRNGTGQVYIGTIGDGYIVTEDSYDAGYIYNFGSPTTIRSEDGSVYNIPTGKTSISSLTGFRPGIYTLNNAIIGGDTLSRTVGPSSIAPKAGLAMDVNGSSSVAVYNGSGITYGTDMFDSVSLQIKPDGIPSGHSAPDAVDLTGVLSAYQKLIDRLYWTTVSANVAASGVWSVYDRADAKDYHVTTLMESNNYRSSVLSEEMNEVLTLSAMKQLAEYYDSHDGDLSGLKIGLYGDGMENVPFARGSISDRFGNVLYSDVIFTPFFQQDDTVLERNSDYTIDQDTTVAIWADGQELNSWYADGMEADGYETMFLEKGAVLRVSQLAICDFDGMHNQSTVELKVNKVTYIEPEEIDIPELMVDEVTKNPLMAICVVIGAIVLLIGAVRRDPLFVMFGIGLIAFGLFLSGYVVDWFSKLRVIP